jgi:hypothetical protein
MEGRAVIAKLDLESSLLEKMDWIARRKRGSSLTLHFKLDFLFQSLLYWQYCECRVSENGESIILNLLI